MPQKKKKTPTEKYIDKAVTQALKTRAPTSVSLTGCDLTGVKYDASTLEAIIAVARAAEVNVRALETLAGTLSPAAAGDMTVVQIDG